MTAIIWTFKVNSERSSELLNKLNGLHVEKKDHHDMISFILTVSQINEVPYSLGRGKPSINAKSNKYNKILNHCSDSLPEHPVWPQSNYNDLLNRVKWQ